MPVALYMDVHVRASVTHGLRRRGVDVVTAQEDGRARVADPVLLDRAGELGRVVFTQDEDFLAIAHERQAVGVEFPGVVYASQQDVTVGRCVLDLELIAKVYDPADLANRVEYLPIS